MTDEALPDADLAELGRKLFTAPWDFAWATAKLGELPPMQGLEIAFAGRSNVGKSSLINALTNRKALARTSHTPGRTQELIFFRAEMNNAPLPLTLVDMPGYGYAEASKTKVAAWTGLIHDYLRGRPNLARIFVLIDSRHGVKTTDAPILEELDRAAVSYQIVLTKADAVKGAARSHVLESVAKAIAKRPAAHPDILLTSSETGEGVEALRTAIAGLLKDRQVI
ncbi:MAG: ribosome biogenesis GTP-binding protein YihA/YsxC [Bosea sp. (in: a-proteobacteria)]